MFTPSDLSDLLAADPPLGVSIFLPTTPAGDRTREDPIRLKNLINRARAELAAAGTATAETEAILSPVVKMAGDQGLWQHQDEGLAVFLAPAQMWSFQVPIRFPERVVVGPGFHLRPLLPLLEADGRFAILTITGDRVRRFEASRFAIAEQDPSELPGGLAEVGGESDYENPVQASPPARPHTGTANISKAQVYGDSPAEWRKARLVDFAGRVAAGMDRLLAADPVPYVLVADAETGGHFQKQSSQSHLLAGTIELNPETLDEKSLLAAAYAEVRPQFDIVRTEAIDQFERLQGQADPRAATGFEELVSAAYQGRVETLLLLGEQSVWGRYDQATAEVTVSPDRTDGHRDLLDAVVAETFRHGGSVRALASGVLSVPGPAAAVLRY